MPVPRFRPCWQHSADRGLVLSAVVLCALALASPRRATAQTNAPLIAFDPTTRVVTEQSLFVRVTLCGDQYGVDENSFQISANGTSVRSAFSLSSNPVWPSGASSCVAKVQYEGTISTAAQSTVLSATVTNNTGYPTGSASATYTRPAPVRSVAVVAGAQYVDVAPWTVSVRPFTITNTAAQSDSFSVTAACTGQASCTLSAPATVYLGAGGATTVTVSYGAGGTTGTIGTAKVVVRSKSTVTVADSTWSELTVAAAPAQGVVVANTPDHRDAGQCTRIAVPGAAILCGTLVIDHPLPAMRTMNRTWQPRLIYTAATTIPRPVVAADVTLDGPTDNVTARLVVNGSQVATGQWAGAGWAESRTRRLGLAFVANGWATGAYPYTLEVFRWSGGQSTLVGTVSGSLVVVNRASSPFGAGWWFDGVEQLVTLTDGSGALLWVGSDGSHAIYSPVAPNTWATRQLSAPDTIKAANLVYRRLIAGGGHVAFNWSGQHIASVNRNGWGTQFDYDGSGRLSVVRLPLPNGNTGTSRYEIGYAGGTVTYAAISSANGSTLQRNTVATLAAGSPATITSILDPDGLTTSFGTSGAQWITARVDKRGYQTSYNWNAAYRVQSVSGPSGTGYSVSYTDAAMRGLVVSSGLGSSVSLDSASTAFDGPRTDVVDVTEFWLNTYGAPVRVRDALGHETKVTYSAAWPGIATEVRDPSNSVTTASIRSDGLLASSTTWSFRDDNVAATTSVPAWNTAVRRPTQVQQPLGDFMTMGYDAAGNLLWQRPGADASRQVGYGYNPFGQVTSTTLPYNGVGSFTYDALGNLHTATTPAGWVTTFQGDAFGRDTLVVTPIDGSHSNQARTSFDVLGRAWRTATVGPAMNNRAADSVVVWHDFDEESHVRFTHRGFMSAGMWSQIQHSWTYDALGRVTQEVRDDGTTTTRVLDAAGNATQVWGDRGNVVATAYDALNRPYRHTTPAVTYGQSQCSLPFGMVCYYTWPTRGTTVPIPADTAVFRYDAGGRLVQADNRYARVRRGYTRSGLLTHDSLAIRKVVSSTESGAGPLEFPADWGSTGGSGGGGEPCVGRQCPPPSEQRVRERPTPPRGNPRNGMATMSVTVSDAPSPGVSDDFVHTSVIRYHYDLNGRRDSLYYPASAPCLGTCTQRQGYAYSTLTGALEQIVDLAGRTHSASYDLRGRVVTTSSPGCLDPSCSGNGPWQVSLAYDQDDNVVAHTEWSGSVNVVRDALGRMTTTSGSVSAFSSYDGLGHLVQVNGVSPGTQYETYTYDALGNRMQLQRVALTPTPGDNGIRYEDASVTGRISRVSSDPTQQTYYWLDQNFGYDPAGNAESEASREYVSASQSNLFWSTRSYYDADEKLRVFNRFAGIGPNSDGSDRAHLGVYEEYWYDALGRRVQVWSRRDLGCNSFWPECPSAVNRFVWDGDQVLLERRVTGADTTTAWVDNGSPRTIAYAHMGGLDAPVAVFGTGSGLSSSVMVVPHMNWRGILVDGHAVIGTLPVINWPGKYEALDGAPAASSPYYTWFGDMLAGFTDGSGQKYMRNRYYDPAKGTFTQQDPIGLAGGVNLYGYAGGDPVNYSDPFGLCPIEVDGVPCALTYAAAGSAIGAGAGLLTAGATTVVSAGLAAPTAPGQIAAGAWLGGAVGGLVGAGVDNADAIALGMGKIGNKIRSLLTGILIGKGGGMSEEQERMRRGGEKPATVQPAPRPKPPEKKKPEDPPEETP